MEMSESRPHHPQSESNEKRRSQAPVMKFKEPPLPKDHRKLVKKLSNVFGVENELTHFIRLATMDATERDFRYEVLINLESILLEYYPQVKLYPFGSLVTGLGDRNSDLDVYVNYNGSIITRHGKLVLGSSELEKDQVFRSVLSVLRKIEKMKGNSTFTHVVPIPHARVPIIKTIHRRTGISCDLSFENFLSVRNSELIQFFTFVDPRVRPLMILIRYWGKYYDLTDSTKIKNYGMILLVIVFLSQNSIIPSVYTLQQWKKPKPVQCRIDNWNASFCSDQGAVLSYLVSLEKKGGRPALELNHEGHPTALSLFKLLLQFFKTYADFNASTHVISSLTAQFIPRTQFRPGYEEELPMELSSYKEWCYGQETEDRLNVSADRPFVIQDPFVLNFNVSGCTSLFILERFQLACRVTAEHLGKILSLPPEQSARLRLLDIFRPIQFPERSRRSNLDPSGEIQGLAQTVDENKRNSNVKKQMGLQCKPSKDYRLKFLRQFSNCELDEREVVYRASCLWLTFVKDFFFAFFTSAYLLDVKTEYEYLESRNVLTPPHHQQNKGSSKKDAKNPEDGISSIPPDEQKEEEAGKKEDRILSESQVDWKMKEKWRVGGSEESENDDESGNESEGSDISLSTIQLFSTIISSPSPRELLDSVDTSDYKVQRLTTTFHGLTHNLWSGRGRVLTQLEAEAGLSSRNPLETEAEISRRLIECLTCESGEGSNEISFDCSLILRPTSFQAVVAEVQLREGGGIGAVELMKALKATMLDTIERYVEYRYEVFSAGLKEALPTSPPPHHQPSQTRERASIHQINSNKPGTLSSRQHQPKVREKRRKQKWRREGGGGGQTEKNRAGENEKEGNS